MERSLSEVTTHGDLPQRLVEADEADEEGNGEVTGAGPQEAAEIPRRGLGVQL